MTLLVILAALQGASGTPLNVPAPAQYTTPTQSSSLNAYEVGGIAVAVVLLVLLLLFFLVIRPRGGAGKGGGGAATEAEETPSEEPPQAETVEETSMEGPAEGTGEGETAVAEGGAAATWDENTGGKEDIDNLMNELDEISDSILKNDETPGAKKGGPSSTPSDDDADESSA